MTLPNIPVNKKPAPRIMFGVQTEFCNKAIVGGKSTVGNGYELHIYEIEGYYHTGDGNIRKEDITGEYAILNFCKRSSLQAMIHALQQLDDMWEQENK